MVYFYKCCIGGCEETQACPLEEVLTSLFIIFLQRTFLAFSHSIRLTNIGLANIGLANIRLANIGLANTGLANTGLANTGLSAVAWERTPISGRAPITVCNRFGRKNTSTSHRPQRLAYRRRLDVSS